MEGEDWKNSERLYTKEEAVFEYYFILNHKLKTNCRFVVNLPFKHNLNDIEQSDLCQIEGILNSRPLTVLSANPNNSHL